MGHWHNDAKICNLPSAAIDNTIYELIEQKERNFLEHHQECLPKMEDSNRLSVASVKNVDFL